VLPANKGNMTVIMNTSDYKKKMKNLFSDKANKKLDKDPTNCTEQTNCTEHQDPDGKKQHSQ